MRKPIALLLLALVAAAGNVQASSQFTAQPAGHAASSAASASAAVNFRIVIRESISLGGEQQKSRPDTAPMVQSVSVENGREVVTLARP